MSSTAFAINLLLQILFWASTLNVLQIMLPFDLGTIKLLLLVFLKVQELRRLC